MIHYDCHAHVYEQVNVVNGARYVPAVAAPLHFWRHRLDAHKLRGGVIVQVSFLGTDNSELCSALAQLDLSRFAGVAVATPSIEDEEIDRLHEAGVRGFRWNLVRGAVVPDLDDPEVRNFLNRINDRGMHLELHLESPRLASLIGPLLDTGSTIVVDHMGLPTEPEPAKDPWLQAIAGHRDLSRLYVKFSAPYRTPFATQEHVATLQSLLPSDHTIWGSDWPHTQHESKADFSLTASQRLKLPIESDRQAVSALYGLL